jgi:hypothetical protein
MKNIQISIRGFKALYKKQTLHIPNRAVFTDTTVMDALRWCIAKQQ